MLILKLVGFVLTALFFVLFFKDKRSDLAMLIMVASGTIVFIFCLTKLGEIITFLNTIAKRAGIDTVYISIVLKILAICYISSFASEICKDAGCSSLASKVEFAGKIFILMLAVPILLAVLNSILEIL